MAKKTSNTGFGIVSPITAYADGKEVSDLASQYIKIFPANVVGAISLASDSLYFDDIDLEDELTTDEESESESESNIDDKDIKRAPSLSDIELVSNTVVYDASGNPSATVVFKVRNSIGESVKSVNARVQVL
jgi:hypothetical protein